MTLYLDTSSIVKLYVDEPAREDVRRLLTAASIVVTSQIAYPEARSAVARRRRDGVLSAAAHQNAKNDFETDWSMFAKIETTATLCSEAGNLAERYALRGFAPSISPHSRRCSGPCAAPTKLSSRALTIV